MRAAATALLSALAIGFFSAPALLRERRRRSHRPLRRRPGLAAAAGVRQAWQRQEPQRTRRTQRNNFSAISARSAVRRASRLKSYALPQRGRVVDAAVADR